MPHVFSCAMRTLVLVLAALAVADCRRLESDDDAGAVTAGPRPSLQAANDMATLQGMVNTLVMGWQRAEQPTDLWM